MEALNVTYISSASLCLFDDRGRLIGTIHRPLARDPLGPGRATVYLERPDEQHVHAAVAA